MEEQFTLSQLVSFGNYLLGESRRHNIVSNPSNGYAPTDGFVARGNGALNEVSGADLANWRTLNNTTIEDLPQANAPYQDPNEALVYDRDVPPIGLEGDHDMSQQGIGDDPSGFDKEPLPVWTNPVSEPGELIVPTTPNEELSGEPFDNSLEAESRRRRKGGGLVQTYPSLEEGPTFPDPEEPQEI